MWRRIILGFVLPPSLGSLSLSWPMLVDIFSSDSRVWLLEMTGIYLMAAFMFIGGFSIIYSLAMEFGVNRFVKKDGVAVLISILIGAAAGATFNRWAFILVGGLVGLIVGIILRNSYTKEQANNKLQPTPQSGGA